MKHLAKISAITGLALGIFVQISRSQTAPPPAPAAAASAVDTEPSIGPMRIRKLPGFNYLYVARSTTIAQIGAIAHVELPKLVATLNAKGIVPTGAAVLTFHGATADPNHKFQMEIGIQVSDSAVAPEGYSLKRVPAALSATVLYGGPVTGLKKAYGDLYENLPSRDLIPTGETREYYLSWESADSPNNILLLVACVG